jgi:hypothetical protein
VNRGPFGTFATGDLLRVAVVGGVVKYMKNGTVFYTSSQAIVYPLLVDTWIYSQGATLNAAVISGASPPSSTGNPVVWTSIVGVTANGNSLVKTGATGDAGAVSTQQIASGDGYVEVTASETTTYRMFGLSNGNTDNSYQDIDFGLDLTPNGGIYVWEKGVNRGPFGTFATGDLLRVAVVGGVVKYMRNGTVFYTSSQAKVYPLLVDTWIYSQGATLQNVKIGP